MPELEYWTFGAEVPQDQMGINLGAPGDRRDPNGKMWLEHPEVGGPSTKVKVSIEPKDTTIFRLHSTTVKAGDLKWIGGSGLKGAESVTIALKENGSYKVKLHFMEPKDIGAGKRLFDVKLQGETVLSKLDVAKSSGGSRKTMAKEFTIAVKDVELRLEFVPHTEEPSILSGVEWRLLP
jgi:hypothetical protein